MPCRERCGIGGVGLLLLSGFGFAIAPCKQLPMRATCRGNAMRQDGPQNVVTGKATNVGIAAMRLE